MTETGFVSNSDRAGQIQFEGSETAELFAKEVAESFAGLLTYNFVQADGAFPTGFLHASPEGQLCHGQMWTRDAGTFLRELVMWGCFEHAKQVAECLIRLVAKNPDGFHAYPESFKGNTPEAGREIDGTSAIAIGMVLLWQRLPAADPMKARLYEFLHQPASPVRFLLNDLEQGPLVRGTGEFGSGCTINDVACNVVQNSMVVLALSIAADMEQAANDPLTADLYRAKVQTLRANMEKHLVDSEGGWIWCVNPDTLKPEPQSINSPWIRGFGGINGVACMYADVFGFTPTADPWQGIAHGRKTFERLYAYPKRRAFFEKHGLWDQLDETPPEVRRKDPRWNQPYDIPVDGGLTSPSYGHGYALQTMLLYDMLEMADKGLAGLARGVYQNGQKRSPYYFFERLGLLPDRVVNAGGCGELNLVCATEPLKVARLILGVDDSRADETRLVPRVPPSWKSVKATHWPIRTSAGVVRADIQVQRDGDAQRITITVADGQKIPRLATRRGVGAEWEHHVDVA